jgi:hypothetical protein
VDRFADVVVRADDDLGDPGRLVVGAGAVVVEAIAREDRALDEPGGDLVGHVVRQLPAQDAGAELAGAAVDRGRGHPRTLGVEGVAAAQADEQPALALAVVQRQVLEARASLAGLEQGLQRRAVEVVGDALAVEDPDRDGVGFGGDRGVGRGGGAHGPVSVCETTCNTFCPCPRP